MSEILGPDGEQLTEENVRLPVIINRGTANGQQIIAIAMQEDLLQRTEDMPKGAPEGYLYLVVPALTAMKLAHNITLKVSEGMQDADISDNTPTESI